MSEVGMDARWKKRFLNVIAPKAIILFDITLVILVIMTSVDLFGRMLNETKGLKGPPGDGFKRTTSGHFDIEGKMLRNVHPPEQAQDAVTFGTLTSMMDNQMKAFDHQIERQKSGLMKRTTSGHFNVEGKMLRNVRPPEEALDVVTLGLLSSMMDKQRKELDENLERHKTSVNELRSSVNNDLSSLKQTIKKFHEEHLKQIDRLDKFLNDLRQLLPQDG